MRTLILKTTKVIIAIVTSTILLAACESDLVHPDSKLGTPDKSKLIIPGKKKS